MKVRIEKNVLNNGLGQVLNVVGMRTSLPVLSNVRLCAREGALELTTTNLDMGIRCTVVADVTEGGSIALPARRLASIAKALPEGTIEFECLDDQAKLSCGCSKFRIMGMNDAEFPPLPMFEQTEALVVEQQQLRGWLRHVSFAQSEDENRYLLNGVLFAFKGGEGAANGEAADSGNAASELHVVATDGRRLSLMQQSVDVPEALRGKSFILPAKAVGELEHLLQQSAPVKLYFNNRQVGFELELDESAQKGGLAQSSYLVSKQIEGTFPNYLQVLPKTTEHRVRLERTLLLESIQRAALVSSLENNTVKLTFNQNLLEISASSAEFGEAHESIAVEYEADDKPISITFNSKFLTDPLKALDEDTIFFEFKDEVSPGVIKTNDNFRCVVMPLRLG